MADSNYFRQLVLSFPGTIESPHFEKTSFKVNKKIYATLDVKKSLPASNYLPSISLSFVLTIK